MNSRRLNATACLVIPLVAAAGPCGGIVESSPLEGGEEIAFSGNVEKPRNVSAAAWNGKFLIIGSDEGRVVQILEGDGGHAFKVLRTHDDPDLGKIELGQANGEVDVEGIACDGEFVFVVGSHAAARRDVDENLERDENVRRIEQVRHPETRDRLFRFKLAESGKHEIAEEVSLRGLLDAHPVLGRFVGVPSKENGIDIEGVAVKSGAVYLGFRGPVLRGNLVPIVRTTFHQPDSKSHTLYVNLGGRGVRDLVSVADGFLILAGPVGDGPGGYQLYFWDGNDTLPGKRPAGGRPGRLELLGEVPVRDAQHKPEGVCLMNELTDAYEVLVIFDGAEKGGATRFRLAKRN